MNAVQTALEKHQGKIPVVFAARRNGEEYLIKSKRFMIEPEAKLLLKLKELLGDPAVFLQPLR
jgi:hypothetical protein